MQGKDENILTSTDKLLVHKKNHQRLYIIHLNTFDTYMPATLAGLIILYLLISACALAISTTLDPASDNWTFSF